MSDETTVGDICIWLDDVASGIKYDGTPIKLTDALNRVIQRFVREDRTRILGELEKIEKVNKETIDEINNYIQDSEGGTTADMEKDMLRVEGAQVVVDKIKSALASSERDGSMSGSSPAKSESEADVRGTNSRAEGSVEPLGDKEPSPENEVFGDIPEPEAMMRWLEPDCKDPSIPDLVMEQLRDHGLLNERGNRFAYDFWDRYIHEKSPEKECECDKSEREANYYKDFGEIVTCQHRSSCPKFRKVE